MEEWESDFEWLRIRHFLKDLMQQKTLPNYNNVLFLIGIRELGQIQEQWTKEEKEDLMNVGVCTILEMEGYYEFRERDEDGWPHYTEVRPFEISDPKEKEAWMKKKIIRYFKEKIFEDEMPEN